MYPTGTLSLEGESEVPKGLSEVLEAFNTLARRLRTGLREKGLMLQLVRFHRKECG